jgi:serine/threonine protein kinase
MSGHSAKVGLRTSLWWSIQWVVKWCAELLEALHSDEVGDVVGAPTLVGKIFDREALICILIAEVGTPLLQFMENALEVTSMELADYVCASLRATLARAHRKGLVHGDIRPSNIILYTSSAAKTHAHALSDYQVLLCDWGLGRMQRKSVTPRNKRPMGCATFMADALLQGTAKVVEASHDLEAVSFTHAAIKNGGHPPWAHAFSMTDLQTLQSRQQWFTEHMV